MIQNFKGQGASDVFNGLATKSAHKVCPHELWAVAVRKLDQIDSAATLDDLRVPPGNQLEKLSHDRKGQYSIRINQQWRICFVWRDGHACDVATLNYH